MESTERLSLPMIIAGQAQKEVLHNEALQRLDAIVAGAVEGAPADDPPNSPVAGTCYIVGQNPSGAWADYPGHLAACGAAGWQFIAPVIGLSVLEKPSGLIARYGPGGWEVGISRAAEIQIEGRKVVGDQVSAIADPAGGAIIDVEGRSAIAQILSALRQHGLIAS